MGDFTTILVANRGEIACRVMRTAKRMGYRTAAVYSEADADARHVRQADLAASIGPAEAKASYLDIRAIVSAARRLGAEAVHPGYGFLSENADFARACAEAGLVFIGPSASAIEAMGDKAEAKRRMVKADVPCVPGYQGADQTDATLARETERIGSSSRWRSGRVSSPASNPPPSPRTCRWTECHHGSPSFRKGLSSRRAGRAPLSRAPRWAKTTSRRSDCLFSEDAGSGRPMTWTRPGSPS